MATDPLQYFNEAGFNIIVSLHIPFGIYFELCATKFSGTMSNDIYALLRNSGIESRLLKSSSLINNAT